MNSNLAKLCISFFVFLSTSNNSLASTPKDLIINTKKSADLSMETKMPEIKSTSVTEKSQLKPLQYEARLCETLYVDAKSSVLARNMVTDNNSSVELTQDVRNGKLDLSKDGRFTYTPNLGSQESDSFSYIITNKNSNPVPGIVNIKISGRSEAKLENPGSENPLFLLSDGAWKSGQENSKLYALRFEGDGKMYLYYNNSSSGLVRKEAIYQIEKTPISQCPSRIDFIMKDGRTLKTVFQVVSNGKFEKVLKIELVGIRFGEDRPKSLTNEGTRSFNSTKKIDY